jgi:plasmid stabilization system protein ParE
MARGTRKLALNYSPESLADLDEIWEWNAKHHGFAHADRYVAALKSATLQLAQLSDPGLPVPTSPIYRCAILKRRRKGHGHVVAFTVENQTLYVWRYFHTSQDWQNKLADNPGSEEAET